MKYKYNALIAFAVAFFLAVSTNVTLVHSAQADTNNHSFQLSPFGTHGEGGYSHDQTFSFGEYGKVYEIDSFICIDDHDLNGDAIGTCAQLSRDALPKDLAVSLEPESTEDGRLLLHYSITQAASADESYKDVRFSIFIDPEIHDSAVLQKDEDGRDESSQEYANEFGEAIGWYGNGSGDAVPDSWEIDEPGYVFGDLFNNLLLGTLDSRNGVSVAYPDDVAVALGFKLGSFELGTGKTVTVLFSTDEDTLDGVALKIRDKVFGTSLTISGQSSIEQPEDTVANGEQASEHQFVLDIQRVETEVVPPQAVCGNGSVEARETCDDGNTHNWDGCSDDCSTEAALFRERQFSDDFKTYCDAQKEERGYDTCSSYVTNYFDYCTAEGGESDLERCVMNIMVTAETIRSRKREWQKSYGIGSDEIALELQDPDICKRDDCFKKVAIGLSDPYICDSIHDRSTRIDCYRALDPGYDVRLKRLAYASPIVFYLILIAALVFFIRRKRFALAGGALFGLVVEAMKTWFAPYLSVEGGVILAITTPSGGIQFFTTLLVAPFFQDLHDSAKISALVVGLYFVISSIFYALLFWFISKSGKSKVFAVLLAILILFALACAVLTLNWAMHFD
ncbi:MAG: hypothetical protein PHZ00_01220 [Candidatus Peribacteraceae bacterium]|nr:hypothetical protein [Candidatus Peribacteraceae bacterium]